MTCRADQRRSSRLQRHHAVCPQSSGAPGHFHIRLVQARILPVSQGRWGLGGHKEANGDFRSAEPESPSKGQLHEEEAGWKLQGCSQTAPPSSPDPSPWGAGSQLARCQTCGSVPQTVRLRPQHFERDCITEEGFHATSHLLGSQPWASHWACLACGFNVGNRTTHKTFAVGDRRAGRTVHRTCSPWNLA